MFKVVGFLTLSAVLLVNSEKYNDDYELMNDEDGYAYNGDNDYNYEIDQGYEEGFAENQNENYEDDYDFSEFDALYAAQEGYNDDNDIAFGNFAKLGQYPYTVYLRIKKSNNKVSICSGSIIGPQTVLTAYHCLNNNPKSITVEAGTLVGNKKSKTRQVRTMKKFTRPTQKSSKTGKDVGLIYVKKAFKFNKNVNKISLCGSRKSKVCGNKVLKAGKKLYASGFGLQGAKGSKSGVLKYASMKMQSDNACKKAKHKISAHHICTKGGSGNTCGGDSGGPLVIRRSSNGKNDILVGANSYSRTKCTNKNGNWDVFFEISYGKSWYNKKVPKDYKKGVKWV